jgi:hypothetical protein
MQARWQIIDKTSNSGKQLYRCLICERVSPTPDKDCPTMDCGSIEHRLKTEPRDLRKDKSREWTDAMLRDPRPGDRLHEMYSYWITVQAREGDMVGAHDRE